MTSFVAFRANCSELYADRRLISSCCVQCENIAGAGRETSCSHTPPPSDKRGKHFVCVWVCASLVTSIDNELPWSFHWTCRCCWLKQLLRRTFVYHKYLSMASGPVSAGEIASATTAMATSSHRPHLHPPTPPSGLQQREEAGFSHVLF